MCGPALLVSWVIPFAVFPLFPCLLVQDLLNLYKVQDEAGLVVVAENLSPWPVQVEFDASEHTKGFASSRSANVGGGGGGGGGYTVVGGFGGGGGGGGVGAASAALMCQDVLPARSRQLLMVLSIDATKKFHSLGYRIGAAGLSEEEASALGMGGLPGGGGGGPGGGGTHIPSLEHLGELAALHEPMAIPAEELPPDPAQAAQASPPQFPPPAPRPPVDPNLVSIIQGMLGRIQKPPGGP